MNKTEKIAQLEEELEVMSGELRAALKTIAENEKAFERLENGFFDLQCDLFSGPYYKAYRS